MLCIENSRTFFIQGVLSTSSTWKLYPNNTTKDSLNSSDRFQPLCNATLTEYFRYLVCLHQNTNTCPSEKYSVDAAHPFRIPDTWLPTKCSITLHLIVLHPSLELSEQTKCIDWIPLSQWKHQYLCKTRGSVTLRKTGGKFGFFLLW